MRRTIKRNAAGDALASRLEVRFFYPGNEKSKLYAVQAKPGTGHTEKWIDETLENFCDQVDRLYPTEEYELVELAGAGRFNVVWRGSKPTAAQQNEGIKICKCGDGGEICPKCELCKLVCCECEEEAEYVGDPELVAKANASRGS